jgi:hypothetical protein
MSGRSFSRSRLGFVIPLVVLAYLALPAAAAAAVSRWYDFSGVEIWATSTVGTFAGRAEGSRHDSATWVASIVHTVVTQPQGSITGGYADLVTSDLTHVHGDFIGGTLTLVSTGSGSCGNLTHDVDGMLDDVTRSDSGRIGTGSFVGTLIHYRTWVFGSCVTYSASASGRITLHF